MSLHLTKHHGLGNDFLIALNPSRPIGSSDAADWCRRHRGIGADGLIVATGTDDAWDMVLFNADGSQAELSGNGLRCLGQAVAMERNADGPLSVTVHTLAGRRDLAVIPGTPTASVEVDMGPAKPGPPLSQRWAEVGIAVRQQLGVDMGNPHLVGLVDDLRGLDIGTIGPVVEADYPDGCNVHLVTTTGDDELSVLHWERGVGVTEACGSGASASAFAANSWGLVGPTVSVVMPGGAATISVGETVTLRGPATYIGAIEVPSG